MKKLTGLVLVIVALLSFQNAPKKQEPSKPKTGAVTHAPVSGLNAVMDRGKTVYLLQCLACHQADGGGVSHLNAPLAGATAVVGKDKARLINIVLKGLNDHKEIDGETYSNNMAPHPELTDLQIADVLTYVRNNWGNKATAVTPAEVKMVRSKIISKKK